MSNQPPVARAAVVPDDRILPETRWLAGFIIPFLVVAFYILYLRPTESGELFAWPIKPTMTAMMLASAYIGGVYYFTCVLLARRWHQIKVGLLPVTAFASVLSIATLLHWDRFTQNHISFYTWTTLYMTTPLLVLAVWLRNRVTDPGLPGPGDPLLPRGWRWAMGSVGVVTIAISLLLFVQPALMIGVWPWQISPLTARVVSAMFALPGLVGLGIALDSRWSSARLILQSQAFSLLFILLGAMRAWGKFNHSGPAAYLFVGGLAGLFVGIVALSLSMESRRLSEQTG